MNHEHLKVLEELKDCQGTVNDSEYNEKDKKLLRELEKQQFVSLCWVITMKGEKVLNEMLPRP